eukprot:g39606.t1
MLQTAVPISNVRVLQTRSFHQKTSSLQSIMGLDGGTIPSRSDLLRRASWRLTNADKTRSTRGGQIGDPNQRKSTSEAQRERRRERMRRCALSNQELRAKELVCCRLGYVYNRSSVVHFIAKQGQFQYLDQQLHNQFNHLKSLSSIFPLHLSLQPSPANTTEHGEDKVLWACAVTGDARSGRYPLCTISGCGHVLQMRVLKELKARECPECGHFFAPSEIVELFAEPAAVDVLRAALAAATPSDAASLPAPQSSPTLFLPAPPSSSSSSSPTNIDTSTSTAATICTSNPTTISTITTTTTTTTTTTSSVDAPTTFASSPSSQALVLAADHEKHVSSISAPSLQQATHISLSKQADSRKRKPQEVDPTEQAKREKKQEKAAKRARMKEAAKSRLQVMLQSGQFAIQPATTATTSSSSITTPPAGSSVWSSLAGGVGDRDIASAAAPAGQKRPWWSL